MTDQTVEPLAAMARLEEKRRHALYRIIQLVTPLQPSGGRGGAMVEVLAIAREALADLHAQPQTGSMDGSQEQPDEGRTTRIGRKGSR